MRLNRGVNEKRERPVADKLAARWRCEWAAMGPYSPMDVYFMRSRQLTAIAEIRTRNAAYSDQAVIWLSMSKWFHMSQCEMCLALPAFYVMAFIDGIYQARIGELPVHTARKVQGGRTDRTAPNDLAPAILVPAKWFKLVCDSSGVFEDAPEAEHEG